MLRKLLRQLRFLLNRGRSETDLERQIRFHIEAETREHVDEGLPETEARRVALADFGSIPACQETVREVWGLRIWSDLRRDFRYAFRMIYRKPGFALMTILTMAVGVGATAAVFAVFDRAVLRPFPFGDSARLVYISETRPGKEFGQMAASYPNFEDWKQSNHSFQDIAGLNGTNFTVTGLGLPFRISAVRVTTNFLSVLKVRPQFGRDFLKEEEPLENSSVVIISDGFWHRFFGARSGVVGETIRLGGVPHTIVGVLPESFRSIFGGTPDLIVPLAPTADQRTRRQSHWLLTFARLRDGVTTTEADTEMKAIAAQLAAGHADTNAGTSARVVSLRKEVAVGIRPTLGVIGGAAIFMFCLALANLANLMIAQSATRQREMAIRSAIGAGTMRLGRQLLAESLVLAAIAAAASLVVANLTLAGMTRSIPQGTNGGGFPSVVEASVDARTAAFAFLLAMLGGLIAGSAVVFRLSRNPLTDAVRRDSASAPASQRLRSIFIVAEVALAVALLVGAVAMLRSVQQLLRVNPGFQTDNRLVMNLSLPQSAYPKSENVANFYENVRNRAAQLPGVEQAGVIDERPLTHDAGTVFVYAFNQAEPASNSDAIETVVRSATVNYFETMGIPLKSGRTFAATDRADSTKVALINEMLATRLFGQANPVGQRLVVKINHSVYEVAGVVGDVALRDLDSAMRPTMYMTFVQEPSRSSHLVIKTAVDPNAMTATVRGLVQQLDPELPVYGARSFDETINLTASVVMRRLVLFLIGAFSIVGAVMAAVGLYGLMTFVVTQRSHEIGIRIALGAEHSAVKRLVLNQALRMTGIGLVIGTGLAIASGQLIQSVVFGVAPSNPTILVTVAIIVGLITYAACYAPVRRALRLDPVTVLRHD